MRMTIFCLISLILSVASAQSRLYVDENSLPAYMLNQQDPLFYSEGVIANGETSSLCGPTSVMNWLQLREQNAFRRIQLVQFIKLIGEDLRKEGIDINNGLTEAQLLKFLELYSEYLEKKSNYILKHSQEFAAEELLNNRIQILMLRYIEKPRFRPGGPRRDEPDLRAPVYGNHYVLKIFADSATATLFVIDPENPQYISKLKLQEGHKISPLSTNDLASFQLGVPLQWRVNSFIEEQ